MNRRLLIVVAALALGLSACSSAATEAPATQAPTAAPTAAATEAPTAATGVDPNTTGTLTIWHYYNEPTQLKVLDDMNAMFKAKYPNVTLEVVYVPFDKMTSKVLAAASAQQGPDVMIIAELAPLADAGAVIDLTPTVDAWSDKDQFPTAAFQVGPKDNKIYAIQTYVNLLALWYNKDILDKVGVAPPTTMDELGAALEKITAAGYEGITLCGKPDGEGEWQSAPWFYNEGSGIPEMEEAATLSAFQRLEDWVKKGYISKESTGWGQGEAFGRWLTGKAAFSENGNWQIAEAAKTATFNYGVVEMPAGPKGTHVYLGGEMLSIGGFSKQQALAWEYIATSWASTEGGIAALKGIGSLPTRKDAASQPEIASDPILKVFAQAVQNGISIPPSLEFNNAQRDMGPVWGAAIAGQKDAAALTQEAIDVVNAAFGR